MLMRSVRKPRRVAVYPEPSPGRAPRRVPRAPRLGQGCVDAGTGIPRRRLTLATGLSWSRRKAWFGLKGFHFGSVGRWEQSAVPALRQLHPLSPPHAALFAPFPFSLHGHAHIHVAPGVSQANPESTVSQRAGWTEGLWWAAPWSSCPSGPPTRVPRTLLPRDRERAVSWPRCPWGLPTCNCSSPPFLSLTPGWGGPPHTLLPGGTFVTWFYLAAGCLFSHLPSPLPF